MSLPLPPKQQAKGLHLHTIAAGSRWFRIHRCCHPTALHWGRHNQGSWNAVDGAFGVLYLADCLETAFAETYGHQVMDNQAPAGAKFLSRQELQERCINLITATRELEVLDLSVCQVWSRWWHDAAEPPDGLLYPSRLLPCGTNLALYEHCSDAWCEEPLGDLMHWREGNGEPAVLEILDAHGWGLVD